MQVPEYVKNKKRSEEGDVLAQVVGWMEEARGWSDISGYAGALGYCFKVHSGWMWDWEGGKWQEGYEELDDEEGGVRLPTHSRS